MPTSPNKLNLYLPHKKSQIAKQPFITPNALEMTKMKLTKNLKALSKLSITILIIASLIVGALLSYLWVMGYYLTLGIKPPEEPALSIKNVVFTSQNTSYFNVTFFNPSYSKDTNLIRIVVKSADNKFHNITVAEPEQLPKTIGRASDRYSGEETLQCIWDWANYTGKKIIVVSFVDEGSGPTYETEPLPLVDLKITDVRFNSSISVTNFTLTIENPLSSETYVNISRITVPTGDLLPTQVSPSLETPYKLDINQTQTFNCTWNWKDYLNKTIPITVHTVQGYAAYLNTTTLPLNVEITNVVFSESNMTNFDVTVTNRNESSTSVDINKITVTLQDGTEKKINQTQPTLTEPYKLNASLTETFKCQWNWTEYRGKSVTVSIFTAQNYNITYIKVTPSPIEIIDIIFSTANTSRFSVNVRNSPFYYNHVNITSIALTFENGTEEEIDGALITPSLYPEPFKLDRNSNQTFTCPWNWIDYQSKNVTITVRTIDNYIAQSVETTPAILAITCISFDTINTSTFDVTIRNSAPIEIVNIANVTVTLDNGTVRQVPILTPSSHLINPASTVTFTCQWNWTDYRGKNITITAISAEKGYMAFSRYTTPPFQ